MDLRATHRLVTELVERELRREGLPPATFGNLRSQELILAKTADRSVLGCMNDITFSGAVRRRAHQSAGLALRARTSRYRGLPSSRQPRAVRGTVVTVNPGAVRSLRTACSGQVR